MNETTETVIKIKTDTAKGREVATLTELLKNIDIKGIIFCVALTSQRADDYY